MYKLQNQKSKSHWEIQLVFLFTNRFVLINNSKTSIRKLNQKVFRMIVPKIDQCGMKEKRAFEKRKNPGKKSLNEGTQQGYVRDHSYITLAQKGR